MFHLRYFLAVADELHFTRAAERLRMAASPLSRRIRDLERELGADLFVRTHHRVALTAAGEALLPHARDVVGRFDALAAVVRTTGPQRRSVVVGVAPDVAPEVRDTFLARLHGLARLPGLDVRLHPDNTAPLVRAVRAREIDIAFVHGRVTGADLTTVRVDEQPAGVAVGSGTGFDGRTSVRLGELAWLPYASISQDAAPSVYKPTDDLLVRHGVVRRIELDSHHPADLAHIVAAGQAFTIVGLETGATHKAFVGEPVLVLPVDGTDLRLTTDAVWRTDRDVPGDVVADLAVAVIHRPPELSTAVGGDVHKSN
ncbi:LysR family transcriptional regulator [Pseudonocardia sp.]|jgi:DNA-binding transcriptional LysR family regulator|uniref:LysR family transcriptional regulator n=1 Tax=Pseudonocardia sp. TaxID=60912 RepID=UPI002608F0F1|nr:LysR family transcriptional regulator [Pseudonocardia sp.]MCW2720229.1 DNA-binding transcriptional regulator, LysR family [Pseudonocardia sp.]MDT7613874.1 hypothetical protein [Pseudonocardiales bacterium]